MSNQRLLAIGFIVITTSVTYVTERVTDAILGGLELDNFEVFGGLTLSWVLAVVLTVGAALALWFNARIQEVGQDVAAELRKVTWPTWPEIRAATGAVVVVTVVTAALLGVMDFVSAKVMAEWIPAGIGWAQGLFG